MLEERAQPYFQDVYDHLLRQSETIDLYRDLLAGSLDAYLSVVSNDLNTVMKRLTALTVIIMVPTLIAGIYGMNFDNLPELRWPLGYFGALGLMVVVAGVLALLFRRSRWL
jgi:magnesium transporter